VSIYRNVSISRHLTMAKSLWNLQNDSPDLMSSIQLTCGDTFHNQFFAARKATVGLSANPTSYRDATSRNHHSAGSACRSNSLSNGSSPHNGHHTANHILANRG
jgi:hypothetical protein